MARKAGWRPIAEFSANEAWLSESQFLISGKYANGVRYKEEGMFIGHSPGLRMGHWSGRRLDPPDYFMPFPDAPEDTPAIAQRVEGV